MVIINSTFIQLRNSSTWRLLADARRLGAENLLLLSIPNVSRCLPSMHTLELPNVGVAISLRLLYVVVYKSADLNLWFADHQWSVAIIYLTSVTSATIIYGARNCVTKNLLCKKRSFGNFMGKN